MPLEAAAAGRPTIAYGAGGALETIVEGETGAFFHEPERRRARRRDPRASTRRASTPPALRAHAEQFRPERFVERLRAIVDDDARAR